MKIFDYLNAMTKDKKELDFNNNEVKKDYQPYMINRFVSMCELYVPLVNEINKYDVPKETHFRYFYSSLPKRTQYFKYIKKKKDLDLDQKKCIAEYFEIGLREAEEYIRIMDEKDVNRILEIYKYGRK